MKRILCGALSALLIFTGIQLPVRAETAGTEETAAVQPEETAATEPVESVPEETQAPETIGPDANERAPQAMTVSDSGIAMLEELEGRGVSSFRTALTQVENSVNSFLSANGLTLTHHGPEDLMISLLTIVGALAVMFTIEWRLALVVCVILPILLIVVITRRRKMSRVSRGVKKRTAAINAEIESSLSGIRTAKAFANEAVEFGKFSEANDRFKVSKREFHREMGIFSGSLEFFLSILSVAVITVGGTLIMQGRMDLVDLFTFSLYISTFTSPVRKLVNFAEMFANGFAGLGRFVELMRTEPKLRDAPDAKALGHVRGSIDVEDVSFSYEENQEVLEHVTLHVRPGETVAVVGPSGGGKSTLCRLIPRFYDVTSGRICIDGQDVRSVTQESLHHAIGVVQQDVFLFADTIANNIRYGRPDATMEEIREAARQAEIYDDIMAMPDGFDTYVGERGTLLSGGQKQRVSIARIFLKNPPILILDEATSALDSVTESKIQHALDHLAEGRTTLIIAHRLSTIRSASRILVVADGRICEQGTHEELMRLGGLYATLRSTQDLSSAE